MSKITISLVGGQPFPVYAQALDCKPDILLLLHSKETKRNAERIEQCVKKKLPSTVVQPFPINVNDLKKSETTFKALAKTWLKPENDITVNLSGGTKPWSMQLYKIFGDSENTHCVFIDQNNFIWDMNTLEHHAFDYSNISLDDKFALFGVNATGREPLEKFTDEDLKAIAYIERLYHFNSNALKEIVERIEQDSRYDIHVGLYYNTSRTCCIKRSEENTFECHFEEASTDKSITLTISSPHAARLLISAGWFELKVARLLSEWYGASKVWLNTIIRYANHNDPINEIDIIVETTNGKLLFVECKTQVYAPTDIDKFNDVIKSYGGLGSKRIFVTYWPMKALAKGKCDALDIRCFSTTAVMKDKFAKRQFYETLDRYLDTINDR